MISKPDKNDSKDTFDNNIEQAFRIETAGLPEEKYFRKIWDSIESHSPVGEKYYFRSFFTVFFFLAIAVIFILFYTNFFSTVVTLKEIEKQNNRFSSNPSHFPRDNFSFSALSGETTLTQNISVASVPGSGIHINMDTPKETSIDFYSGHAVFNIKDENKTVVFNLPGLEIKKNKGTGKVSVLSYDGIIRIIPFSFPVEIRYKGKQITIAPPETFYLLDEKQEFVK